MSSILHIYTKYFDYVSPFKKRDCFKTYLRITPIGTKHKIISLSPLILI